MSDEIKYEINDLKREMKKAIDMLYDIKSDLERFKQELKALKYAIEEIKNKINQ